MSRITIWLAVAVLGLASCASAFTSVTFKVPWQSTAARWQIQVKGMNEKGEKEQSDADLVESPPLQVLELDKDFLIVNKPWDVRIEGDHDVTVMKMALKLFPPEEPPHLRFCHRLDYATSGVMCMALSKVAASAANRLFENRGAAKQYLAICYGHLEEDALKIETPIAEYRVSQGEARIHPTGCPDSLERDFRMCIGNQDNPGRPALTEVLVLDRGEYRGSKVTKVMLTPHTGRRHQLRVHLNSIGHPIVGDYTYCGDADSPRMMLHAHKLTLPLPPRFGNTRSWEATDPFDDILVRSQ